MRFGETTPDRRRRLVRLQDLVGARVRSRDGHVVGRIQEVRAERRGDDHEVIEYRLGAAALLERLALTRRLFGRRQTGLIVRWDQLDIAAPEHPTLTCGVDELERI
jgi:hypothetical protein